MARATVCDGCGMPTDPAEEVGYLGAFYCAKCAEVARRYTGLVKSLREAAAESFEAGLEALRQDDAVAWLKRRPDQAAS